MLQRIMVVDDEAFQRNALQLALHRFFSKKGVEVEAYGNPLEALERAQTTELSVVVADYRMPQMNGIDFLSEMLATQPDAVRLMLTASSDFETAITAVNQAEVFKFVRKPWGRDFRQIVADALARNLQLTADRGTLPGRSRAETDQQRALRELEASEPGITKVRWGPDGSVLLQ